MRDLIELPMDHHGKPVATPPPTGGQIALVERLLKAPLPEDYVAFLRFSNGGHPQLDTFYITRDGAREPWTIDHFFHVAADSPATEDTRDVLWQYRTLEPDLPQRFLPIADNGFGDLLLLDLTDGGQGRVVLWVHDEDWPLFEVAESFAGLIDGLTTYPGDLEALARGEG